MVAILTVPLMISFDPDLVKSVQEGMTKNNYDIPKAFHAAENTTFWWVIILVSVAALFWAVWQSHREASVSLETSGTTTTAGTTPAAAMK